MLYDFAYSQIFMRNMRSVCANAKPSVSSFFRLFTLIEERKLEYFQEQGLDLQPHSQGLSGEALFLPAPASPERDPENEVVGTFANRL